MADRICALRYTALVSNSAAVEVESHDPGPPLAFSVLHDRVTSVGSRTVDAHGHFGSNLLSCFSSNYRDVFWWGDKESAWMVKL